MFKKNLAQLNAFNPGPSLDEIKKKYGLEQVVKLDCNENVYGASPLVTKALTESFLNPSLYPDSRNSALRTALSTRLGVEENSYLFGLGLDEIIVLISRTFLDADSNIVMAWPTFYEYYSHALIEGADTQKIPCDAQGRHDLDSMLAAINDQTKLVWICNPNNPTGTCLGDSELRRFIQHVPEDVIVLLDEAYMDFADRNDFPDALAIMREHPNVLVLRTFSKAYGLASFRVGYAIGDPRIINELEKVRPPFNNPQISQMAAVAALNDQNFLKECVRKNQEVRQMTIDYLSEKKIDFYPTQANFIFVKTEKAAEIAEQLRAGGFLVNPFPTGLRITLGTMADMHRLLPLLADLWQKNAKDI